MTTSIDRNLLKDVRSDLEIALKLISEKHGINISCGNMQFNSTMFRTKVEGRLVGAAQPKHNGFGLMPVGTVFYSGSTRYIVTALYPDRPKYKYVAAGPSGGMWKFTDDVVRNGKV